MGRKAKDWRSKRAIDWIQKYCRIPEGPDVGKRVRLREFQKAEIRKIYDNPAGTRRAIVSWGRKNAKTTLAGFLLLLHLVGPEAIANSQLYSAAQSRDQAALIFALAAKIVRLSPDLKYCVVIRDTKKELFCPDLGTLYRALSAEASTAFGLSPVFIVHDELGQVRGPRSEIYEALETATGAQPGALSVIISTQAPTNKDLLSVLIDDALAKHDPRVVVSLHTAPLEADPFSADTIRLANPAFGDFLNEREVMAMAEDARRMPSREAEFRNLILNQRVEASSPFVTRAVWETCKAIPKPFGKVPVYGGLDLSSTQDLTALVLVGKVDGIWQVHPTFWLPGDDLQAKSRLDRVPYDVWHRQGYLEAPSGRSIEYEFVARTLREKFDQYDIRQIAFDRWNFKNLRPWLIVAGFSEKQIEEKFNEFGQGYQSMSPALQIMGDEIINARVAHGNHPVLSMCADNAVVQGDPAGNRKLAKDKSAGRIDGMVAMAMAFGVAVNDKPPPKFQVMIY